MSPRRDRARTTGSGTTGIARIAGTTGVTGITGVSADTGGDAACWLGELCPECGAVPEGEGAQDPTVPCWRCGTVRASSADGE